MNIKTNNRIRVIAGVALLAALTAGAQAADLPQVHVNYADLNVTTTAGAAVLYQRIRGAADRVCGDAHTRDLARLGQAKSCAAHAVADAVAKVNAPALTQVYDVKADSVPMTRLAAIR